MTVAQLKDFTVLAQQGSTTLMPTRQILTAHQAVVEEKIAEWQNALALIQQKIDFYDQWIEMKQRPASKRPH